MQVRTLLAQPPSEEDANHELRRVFYAINVSDEEKQNFEQRFNLELINGYGLSEALTIVTMTPVFGPKRWPSIGLPQQDREVKIVDGEGQEVPRGHVGEIAVRGVPGTTIMKGYYKNPEATAETIKDGWLHTEDNGYMDEAGYVYFVDRKKDMIKRSGENVSASEVENVLSNHPNIVEVGVLGVPDPIRDEAVKAFIVLDEPDTLTEEDITDYCKDRLANFKVPTIIEFRESLPKTSVGKVEKKTLRAEEMEKAEKEKVSSELGR
jgi:crotonobetaine/carnitine-CoA ligase